MFQNALIEQACVAFAVVAVREPVPEHVVTVVQSVEQASVTDGDPDTVEQYVEQSVTGDAEQELEEPLEEPSDEPSDVREAEPGSVMVFGRSSDARSGGPVGI